MLQTRVLLLDIVDHMHDARVNAPTKSALLLVKPLALPTHVVHVVLGKLVRRARLPKQVAFVQDPWKSRLEGRNVALCRGMHMLELLKFAMPLLELQLTISHGSLFGLQGRLELSDLVVTRCHGSTSFSHRRLTFCYARLQMMHMHRAGL